MKKLIAGLLSVSLLSACAAPPSGGPSPDHGFTTAANGAGYQGYTLYAVVYRSRSAIQVIDKYDPTRMRQYTTADRLF